MKRLKVAGFLVFDFVSRYPEPYRAIARLYAEGRLKWRRRGAAAFAA
jgi:NADPH-dependent curcumin reductase CurA